MRIIAPFLLILLLALPAHAVDLPLLESAEVAGTQVMLRDLLSPADGHRLDPLVGSILLFRAPEPGMKRKVSRETLARLVERQLNKDQLRLVGASNVTVSRKGVWIEPVEVETVLSDYLAAAESQLNGVHLSFEKIYLPPHFMVPSGKLEHQIIPSEPQVIGSQRMTLITRVDGQVVSNRSIRVLIKAMAQVVVASADLRRGEEVAPASLLLQEQDISKLEEPFFALDELVGKQVKQAVRAGQPLQRRQIDFPPLIKRGEKVVIQAHSRNMSLKASGEALQNGEQGETIRVRNTQSQREILCSVLASGLVSVEF